MRRPERRTLSDDAQRELEAIDAVLAGEEMAGDHVRMAELTIAVRELRPRASEEFVRLLDARAEEGFRRGDKPAAPSKQARPGTRLVGVRPSFSRARTLLWRPASGIALAVVLAVAIAVPLLAGGSHRPVSRPLAAPQLSAPATVETRAPSPAIRGTEAPAVGASSSSASKAAATSATPSSSGAAGTRLIERAATLDVGVAPGAIQSSAQRVFTLVSAFGGYVRQSSVSSGEPTRGVEPLHAEEGQRGGASFDIRVPSANLSGAIAALAHLGHVRSENNSTNDVTDEHTTLRDSLGEAQAERSRLLAELRKAGAEAEGAELRSRIQAIDQRIGRLEAQLRGLDQRVTYTNLALSLTPESSSGGSASGGDLTPGGAAHDAARILDAALAVLVIAMAALLPLAVLAIAAWLAIAMTRRRLREQALDAS